MNLSNQCDSKQCRNPEINIYELTIINGVKYCTPCFTKLQLDCGYSINSPASILGQRILERNEYLLSEDAEPLHIVEDGIDYYQCQSNLEIHGLNCEDNHLYLNRNRFPSYISPTSTKHHCKKCIRRMYEMYGIHATNIREESIVQNYIGKMNHYCNYCNAAFYKKERKGNSFPHRYICCGNNYISMSQEEAIDVDYDSITKVYAVEIIIFLCHKKKPLM